MEGCQICHLLWCVLLLLGASTNVWASDEANVTTPSGTTGSPSGTVDELNKATTTTKPTEDSKTWNPPNVPGSDPSSDLSAPPSDTADSGTCFWWLEWKSIALIGGTVLLSTLLVSTITLAVWVCRLKRQVHGGRPVRTNVDLVSGMGYPSSSKGSTKMGSREVSGQPEAGVMLEEVQHTEEGKEVVGEEETAGVGGQPSTFGKGGDSGNGEASMAGNGQTGTTSQSVGSPAGPSNEVQEEVLVVV